MREATLAETTAAPDPVRQSRRDELERAGYPRCDALFLSGRDDVDIHFAAFLLERGCSVQTAVDILV